MKNIITTLLTATALIGVSLAADDKPVSLQKAEAAPAAPAEASVPLVLAISLQEETFSLPIADASALLRKFPSDAERYKELVRRADAKQARLERLVVLRTISGQQAKVEAINELTFPSESARAVGAASGKRAQGKASVALQTRNLGDTLNLTPLLSPDGSIINVTLIPEGSFLAGYNIRAEPGNMGAPADPGHGAVDHLGHPQGGRAVSARHVQPTVQQRHRAAATRASRLAGVYHRHARCRWKIAAHSSGIAP